MRVLLKVKYRVFGYTLAVQRLGWGVSHDEAGNWTVGRLPDVKEADFKGAKTIFNKWGVTLAVFPAELV